MQLRLDIRLRSSVLNGIEQAYRRQSIHVGKLYLSISALVRGFKRGQRGSDLYRLCRLRSGSFALESAFGNDVLQIKWQLRFLIIRNIGFLRFSQRLVRCCDLLPRGVDYPRNACGFGVLLVKLVQRVYNRRYFRVGVFQCIFLHDGVALLHVAPQGVPIVAVVLVLLLQYLLVVHRLGNFRQRRFRLAWAFGSRNFGRGFGKLLRLVHIFHHVLKTVQFGLFAVFRVKLRTDTPLCRGGLPVFFLLAVKALILLTNHFGFLSAAAAIFLSLLPRIAEQPAYQRSKLSERQIRHQEHTNQRYYNNYDSRAELPELKQRNSEDYREHAAALERASAVVKIYKNIFVLVGVVASATEYLLSRTHHKQEQRYFHYRKYNGVFRLFRADYHRRVNHQRTDYVSADSEKSKDCRVDIPPALSLSAGHYRHKRNDHADCRQYHRANTSACKAALEGLLPYALSLQLRRLFRAGVFGSSRAACFFLFCHFKIPLNMYVDRKPAAST